MHDSKKKRLWARVKPALAGFLCGTLCTIAFGFGWLGLPSLGWVTNKTALAMRDDAVVAVLVPICVKEAHANQGELAKFYKTGIYQKGNFVRGSGWATPPGSNIPNERLARTCAQALMKEKST